MKPLHSTLRLAETSIFFGLLHHIRVENNYRDSAHTFQVEVQIQNSL